MHFFGIDVGKTGALCYIGTGSNLKALEFESLPLPYKGADAKYPDYTDMIRFVSSKSFTRDRNKVIIFIEGVHSFSGQGVISTFNFGRSYGYLLAFCESVKFICRSRSIECDFYIVNCKAWQREFGLLTDGKIDKKEKKKSHAIKLLSLYDMLRKDIWTERKTLKDGVVDAYLIAEFGRRVVGNLVTNVVLAEIDFKDIENDIKKKIGIVNKFEDEVAEYCKRLMRQNTIHPGTAKRYLKDSLALKKAVKTCKAIRKRWKDKLKDYENFIDPMEVIDGSEKGGGIVGQDF